LLYVKTIPEPCGKLIVSGKNEVVSFAVRYATSKNYAWTIPVFTLLPLSHGVFAAVTFPMNWIVIGSLTSAAKRAATFTTENVSIDQLDRFARFPQGLPENIDPKTLRLNYPDCAAK